MGTVNHDAQIHTFTRTVPAFLGDGNTSPDWTEPVIDQGNGIITFQLRAEHSGKGNGRVYKITITAVDTSNNTATANVEITVPHDKKKK